LQKRGSTTVPATVLLLAGFVGRAIAPKAIGRPCIKERQGNPLRILSFFGSPASNHRHENQRYIGLDHITGVLVETSAESYGNRLIIGRRGDGQ
jgi:hypothetical protein